MGRKNQFLLRQWNDFLTYQRSKAQCLNLFHSFFSVLHSVQRGQNPKKTNLPTAAVIARTWHGKVLNAKAVEYENYIANAIKVFRKISGNQGYTLFKDKQEKVTHFLVISYWDSKKSITAYAGQETGKVHSLPRDKEFLVDPEETVTNYEIAMKDFD